MATVMPMTDVKGATLTGNWSDGLRAIVPMFDGSYPCWRQSPWLWRHEWRQWRRLARWIYNIV